MDELGEVLHVLSHPHRREILTRLYARDPRDGEEFELVELTGDDELGAERTSLVHIHLPKLADAGFVNWDRTRHTVRRGPRFHQIVPLIDLMVDHRDELPVNWR